MVIVMSLKVHCLGASSEVGRSGFVIQGDKRLLLDYGIKIFDEAGKPVYPQSVEGMHVDAAILSHAHLDHSGFIPELYKHTKIPWYSTTATYDIADVLWRDTLKIQREDLPWTSAHYKKAMKYWHAVAYGNKFGAGGWNCEMYDAGHILGAGMVSAECKGKKVFYTGDFNSIPTRLHHGAQFPKDANPDLLIIESTYANREHPPREMLEKKFAREVKETISEGGTVLCPAFAVGRSQELIMIAGALAKDVPVYLDGMSKQIVQIYAKHRRNLRHHAQFLEDLENITVVESMQERKDATRGGALIISTAGMLEGGPALNYIKYLSSRSKIIFTGYCVEGTNGWNLMNKNQLRIDGNMLSVDLPVEYLDFSAHAGRSQLFRAVDALSPGRVLCVHGDKDVSAGFAQELVEKGYNASAPKKGDIINI
jgi:putative mRNA 3-end processing factor